MSPIGTAGLFRSTMIDTMTALRENSDLLLSTMDVFIKEPLMEWTVTASRLTQLSILLLALQEHALKASKQVSPTGMFSSTVLTHVFYVLFSETNTLRSDNTYAKDRIRSARLKLTGINPAVITASVSFTLLFELIDLFSF